MSDATVIHTLIILRGSCSCRLEIFHSIKTANFSNFDNDTNIVKWMVAKIIHRNSITHMLQPAFMICVLVVLILFNRCSMYVSMFVLREHFFALFNCPFWVLPVLKFTQKNTPYWMWTIFNWITSPGAWQTFFKII